MTLKSKLEKLEKNLNAGKRITWREFIEICDKDSNGESLTGNERKILDDFQKWIEEKRDADKEPPKFIEDSISEESILGIEISPELRAEMIEFLVFRRDDSEEETEDSPDTESFNEINKERLEGAILNE